MLNELSKPSAGIFEQLCDMAKEQYEQHADRSSHKWPLDNKLQGQWLGGYAGWVEQRRKYIGINLYIGLFHQCQGELVQATRLEF